MWAVPSVAGASGRSAPDSHAEMQGRSSQSAQGASSGWMIGVSAAARKRGGALRMAEGWQAVMQSPQRVQAARNSGSAIAPGGRRIGKGASGRARSARGLKGAMFGASHEMTSGRGRPSFVIGAAGSGVGLPAMRPSRRPRRVMRSSAKRAPPLRHRRSRCRGCLLELRREPVTLGAAPALRMTGMETQLCGDAVAGVAALAHLGGVGDERRCTRIGAFPTRGYSQALEIVPRARCRVRRKLPEGRDGNNVALCTACVVGMGQQTSPGVSDREAVCMAGQTFGGAILTDWMRDDGRCTRVGAAFFSASGGEFGIGPAGAAHFQRCNIGSAGRRRLPACLDLRPARACRPRAPGSFGEFGMASRWRYITPRRSGSRRRRSCLRHVLPGVGTGNEPDQRYAERHGRSNQQAPPVFEIAVALRHGLGLRRSRRSRRFS